MTLEQLGAYSLLALYDLFGNTKFQQTAGEELSPLVYALTGRAYDGTQRLVVHAAFQLHPEWASSTNKLWDEVLPFAEVNIPTRYLA